MNQQPIETFTVEQLTVKIYQDDSADSPSEWGDDGLFIVAKHPDFTVPEPGEKSVQGTAQELYDRWKDTHWIFPLEAYIHGQVRLAFGHEGNFPDRRFDVSQVGYVFAAKKEWRLSASARKAAALKIEEWNQYLSGDIYGYWIEADGEHIDSCWGFYGLEHCKQEAQAMAATRALAEANQI